MVYGPPLTTPLGERSTHCQSSIDTNIIYSLNRVFKRCLGKVFNQTICILAFRFHMHNLDGIIGNFPLVKWYRTSMCLICKVSTDRIIRQLDHTMVILKDCHRTCHKLRLIKSKFCRKTSTSLVTSARSINILSLCRAQRNTLVLCSTEPRNDLTRKKTPPLK